MEGRRFDELTRALAGHADRRRVLKGLLGLSVGAVTAPALMTQRGAAQGSLMPGEICQSDDDCLFGQCTAQSEGEAVCNCEDPARPWVGCPCDTGTDAPCGGGTILCCADSSDPGSAGTCVPDSVGCQPTGECSELQTGCENTGCCAEDTTCGANGWCSGCYSGTEDPCGAYNEAFGAEYICCTYGDTTPGAVGYCVAESQCVVSPPNTGSGPAYERNAWMAPAAVAGLIVAGVASRQRRHAEPSAD